MPYATPRSGTDARLEHRPDLGFPRELRPVLTVQLHERAGDAHRLLPGLGLEDRPAADDLLACREGPSVTVMRPFARRSRTPSLLGSSAPVSSRTPDFGDRCTNSPIAAIKACSGPASRKDSAWWMKVRYFMAAPGSGRCSDGYDE